MRTNSEFVPYIERFKRYAKEYGVQGTVNIPVVFGATKDSQYVGLCNIYEDGLKSIEIQRKYWDSKDSDTKESLLFHEFGHCLLNRRTHVSEKAGIYKKSLLHEAVVHGPLYKQFQSYYLQELFHPTPPPPFPQN